MKQHTLTGFEKFGKTTRRAKFLSDMDRIIPWRELAAAVNVRCVDSSCESPKTAEGANRQPTP